MQNRAMKCLTVVRFGRTKTVDFLLRRKEMSVKIINVKRDEEETMTVWREIIKTGDVQAVRNHIAAGADINEKDEFGGSLLQRAALQKIRLSFSCFGYGTGCQRAG